MVALLSRFVLLSFLLFQFAISSTGQQLINQRQLTLLEKLKRPDDHWPRGDGHAVLGEPGSPLSQKGYYEPGGSFSPSPGSFGLSIWVYGPDSAVLATSDNIPLEKIRQEYAYKTGSVIPSLVATTPYYTYQASWVEPGKWLIAVTPLSKEKISLAIVIRSVGPAGGPVNFATWDSTRLLINRRWIITPSSKPGFVTTGTEETGELRKSMPPVLSSISESGWAYAKMGMTNGSFDITLKDTRPQFESMLSYKNSNSQFDFNVPDKQFEHSLKAQVSNLLMGYIGRQTGPGEPVNYPLAWERDGAYSLMAMAKSGHLEIAKELSAYFAENDFFGGFGAEGDAPGSAISALTEVAFLVNDPEYFKWLWPHIIRKLALIDEMRNASGDIYKPFIGPLAPHIEHEIKRRQLICRKTEDSLIVGAMDNHFPVLYINAVSYRGLIQASRLATQMKDTGLAAQCVRKANEIRSAWMKNFGKQKYDNERNFMIGIWPSWITNGKNEFYIERLTAKHNGEWNNEAPKERPLWTYFTVAEAHQWLYAGRAENTWKTLHYFWNNQCSPGLYTYWEGNGEENTFRQWENYRGWLQPKYVTPHYWTASEMTLLQLDMLVYIDESKDNYEIVIGGGVPAEWLQQPVTVHNYKTKAGVVTWEYANGVLNVSLRNSSKKYTVAAGRSFREANTKLNITYK